MKRAGAFVQYECLGVKAQEIVHPDLIWEAGGCETPDLTHEEARMDIHQNARSTPRSRAELVRGILQPQPVRAVAREFGISERTARKWLGRLQGEGQAGLADRSCRPHHSPRTTPEAVVAQVVALRRQRWTGARIAPAVALSRATVGRILRRVGLARLRQLERTAPVRRYE